VTGKIFINYRRGDDPQAAGRLFDRLQDVFKPEQLFLDVDNIAPGLDFVRVLDERVAECDVVLAIIGKSWLEARKESGTRRLDDPDDFVRIEITSALNQGKRVVPVLIGDAQMPRAEDLPEALRPLTRRNAVRLTHERFRADTQGLVKSLQQALDEIEATREAQAETARLAQAEAERTRREAERQQQEAATKQRAVEEREFAAAKTARTILALDAFLAVHPASFFADEATKLRTALVARDDAYQRALASNDPVLLKSFLATYPKGADADQIRARLRSLEKRKTALSMPALAAAATLVILGLGGVFYWLVNKSTLPSTPQTPAVSAALPLPAAPAAPAAQASAASAPAQQADTTPAPAAPPSPATLTPPTAVAPPAVKAASAVKPAAAAPPAVPVEPVEPSMPPARAAAAMTLPANDVDAWAVVKDTNDVALLQHFIAQFPDSGTRRAAEARIAALAAVQTAWNLLKDTTDPDQLRQFIREFPNNTERVAAERRLATLTGTPIAPAAAAPAPVAAPVATTPSQPPATPGGAAPPSAATIAALTPPASLPDPHELARLLQSELMRVGCFDGKVTATFDEDTKEAWHKFLKRTSKEMSDDLSPDAIKTVRDVHKRVCPLVCPHGEHAEGDACVANVPPPRAVKNETRGERPSASPPPAPKVQCQSFRADTPVTNSGALCK